MNTGIPANPRLLTKVSLGARIVNFHVDPREKRDTRGSSRAAVQREQRVTIPRWQRGARLARDRTRSRGAVGTRGGWQRSRLGVQFLISSSYSWKDASATRRPGRPGTGATTPPAPARRRPRAPKTGEMDRVTWHPHSAQCPRCKLFSQESLNHLNHGGP